jgi:hypothetical protein
MTANGRFAVRDKEQVGVVPLCPHLLHALHWQGLGLIKTGAAILKYIDPGKMRIPTFA